jgi:protein-tyrosine-phosphatase
MTTNILILCTHNSARSVLAEGMFNHWAQELGVDARAHSAGSAPSGERMRKLVQVPFDTLDDAQLRTALEAI